MPFFTSATPPPPEPMDRLGQITALPLHTKALAVIVIAHVAYRIGRYTYRRLLTLLCMSRLPYGARGAAPLIVSYSLEGDAYFSADGCSAEIAARRKEGADRLSKRFDALLGPRGRALNETLVAGLMNLSWVGTGRCLFSLDFSPSDYATVKDALLRAALQMRADGWWAHTTTASATAKIIAKELAWQMVAQRVGLA